jgi:hypothetical protein
VQARWPSGDTQTVSVERSSEHQPARVRVHAEGREDFIISIPAGIDRLSARPTFSKQRSHNAVPASYVFFPKAFVSSGNVIAIVTGLAAASDPGSLHAIALNPGEVPSLVLAADMLALADVVDLDRDGVPEIVGKHSLSQIWGPPDKQDRLCFATYDPFAIYRVGRSMHEKATYSLALSELYNRKYYAGWVGPDSSEDWTVVRCGPGGPRIMRAADAIRLFGK